MKIVLFDMDGTLIDSGSDITTSINYVRSTVYGLGPLTISFVVEAINRDQRNLAQLFYERPTYEPAAKSVFEAHYHDQCIQMPRLYEGITALLDDLQASAVRLSVATNAPAVFARRMLEHLGIASLFDSILGSEDVRKSKPHPEMLRTILQGYGFDRRRDAALMVGDSSKDMDAASNAGIPGVFVTWGFSPQGEGDYICSTPAALLQLILKAESSR